MSAISMTWPQYRRGSCSVDGIETYLTPHETALLSILLVRRGSLVTHEELYEMVWTDPDNAPEPKVVEVYICKLRKKVPGVIETLWGRGYRIDRADSADELRVAA